MRIKRDPARPPARPSLAAPADHVIPVSRGGPDSFDNLVVSCYPCNYKKGNSMPAASPF